MNYIFATSTGSGEFQELLKFPPHNSQTPINFLQKVETVETLNLNITNAKEDKNSEAIILHG